MVEQMSGLVWNYIQGRANTKLENFDKEAEKSRNSIAIDPMALAELNSELARKRAEEVAKYCPNFWLSGAALRAKQIGFVTHPLKFTNTDAKGSSVDAKKRNEAIDSNYLTTDTLVNPQIDVAVKDAKALDVAGLLRLEVNGVDLASLIAQGDMSALQSFAENEAQLAEWQLKFRQALVDENIRSHTLAKQLYFPISDDAYHLISPLYASSLAQEIYQRVSDSRFQDAAKEVRKLKREGKYSESKTVDYLNVAVQTFGGTKPQNVSQLNSSRGGKSFLLSCQAPTWSQRMLPPATHKNSFWQEYGRRYDRRAWRTAKELKTFLLKIVDLDSTKPRRDKRSDLVDELIDILFQYASEVQSMTDHAGWSEKSKLSRSEQLWLDPLREDAQFKAERKAKDWQQDIASQFANWLNHQLKDDKLIMKDIEYREWSKLLGEKLARLKEDIVFEEDVEELAE